MTCPNPASPAGPLVGLDRQVDRADHGARLGQGADGVRGVDERQPVCGVLAPGERMTGPRPDTDAEVEPPAGHHVDRRDDLGQHRRRPEAVAGHEQPHP
jgi:hypothetical protein